MQRIAAVDAGSNALRMMIANIVDAAEIEPVRTLRLPVRLGQDVFAAGALQAKTIRRTTKAFQRFRRMARQYKVARLRAVATSALREAANRDVLLKRIARDTGIRIEVISAAEEARLIHLAVSRAIRLDGKRALLIDVGGGSVEVTLAEDRRILSTESYHLGAVRLLQELGQGHDLPPGKSFSALVHEFAESSRQNIHHQIGIGHVDLCAVTGGTAEDLGRLAQLRFKRRDDTSILLSELQKLIELLEHMSLEQRVHRLGLRADRADVILPAALVLQMIGREAHVRRLVIPHVGVKDGVLIEMAEGRKKANRAQRRLQVLESARRLCRKYGCDRPHASRTARLSAQLFDQSRDLHGLGAEERLLLETAALLHDIGRFIDANDHQRHGFYILGATPLIGLTEAQRSVVASLVRYHSQAEHPAKQRSLKRLPRNERELVVQLAALLRLADAMDATHAGRVHAVELARKKKGWQLKLRGRGDLLIERWEVEKRRALFAQTFGVKLDVKVESS